MNKKVVCDCNGEPVSWRNTVPGTFFLMPSFNNRFAPIYTNPNTDIRTGVVSNINNNRINCATCDYDTKQQRLSIRNKPTPWRMPYNHSRKSFTCVPNCTENEKIIKDTPLDSTCCKPIYTTGRLVGKTELDYKIMEEIIVIIYNHLVNYIHKMRLVSYLKISCQMLQV